MEDQVSLSLKEAAVWSVLKHSLIEVAFQNSNLKTSVMKEENNQECRANVQLNVYRNCKRIDYKGNMQHFSRYS